MNGHPLISIIIPIYKVEVYLDECIQSVLNQTYQNLEIILVDDGSPDRCGEICDTYAEKDSRIKVIHQINAGQSAARNAGLELCSGKYLFFLDADDYIRNDAIEVLLESITQSGADMVCSMPCVFLDGTLPQNESIVQHVYRCYCTEEAICHYVKSDWGPWGKLYRYEVHENIMFPTGRIYEDEAIMIDLLERCQIVCDIDDKVYFYRKRDNSTTSTGYSIKRMDWFYSWERNVEIAQKRHKDAFGFCLAKAWMVVLYNIGNMFRMDSLPQEIYYLNAFIDRYKEAIIKCRNISFTRKLRLIILLLSAQKQDCLYTRIYGHRDRRK